MWFHVLEKRKPTERRDRERKRHRNDYITYTMDDDRQSVCVCALLPPRDRVLLRKPKLGRRDRVVVDLRAASAAVESRTMGTKSSRFQSVEEDKTCRLKGSKQPKTFINIRQKEKKEKMVVVTRLTRQKHCVMADCRVLNNDLMILALKLFKRRRRRYSQVCIHSVIVVASIKYPRQTLHVKLDWSRLSSKLVVEEDVDDAILIT